MISADGQPAARDGADVLDHVGLGEAGRPGAQPDLRVHQGGGDLIPARRAQAADRPSTPPGPDRPRWPGRPASASSLPAAGQQARGQRVVLGRPGGQRRLVVGLHPQRRRLVDRALGFQLGLDLGAALGERPQLGPAEAVHLPGVVPVRPPATPSRRTGSAAAGSGRPTRPPGPSRTAGRRRKPRGGRPPSAAPGSGPRQCVCSCGSPSRLVRCTNPATTQPPVPTRRRTPWTAPGPPRRAPPRTPAPPLPPPGGRAATTSATGSEPNAHNSDTLFGAENVRSNASTERGRDPASRSTPVAGCFPSTRARSWSASTTPDKPEALRPPARPHPRRLPHPGVVLVDAQRHRRDQILRVRQPRHRQHQPSPPAATTHHHHPAPTPSHPPAPPSHHQHHRPLPTTTQPRHRHLPPLRGGNHRRRHDDALPKSSAVWPRHCMAGAVDGADASVCVPAGRSPLSPGRICPCLAEPHMVRPAWSIRPWRARTAAGPALSALGLASDGDTKHAAIHGERTRGRRRTQGRRPTVRTARRGRARVRGRASPFGAGHQAR